MALMQSKTSEAPGAPEDKAREAAEEIPSDENRLTRTGSDIAKIKAKMATKTLVLTAMLTRVHLGNQRRTWPRAMGSVSRAPPEASEILA
jgi:hypothetical protein